MPSPKWPWPFRIFKNKWIRLFTLGFVAVIVVLGIVDSLFADFEYIRAIDRLVVAVYFLFWLILYWLRPDIFRE